MEKQNCLIYCNCGAGIITDNKQQALSESFRKLNVSVFELRDICALSLNEKDLFASLEKEFDKKFIVACYPRAIENIFAQNKISLSNYEVLNFRELSEENIVGILEGKLENESFTRTYDVVESALDVPAWYPVIDESRCTLCGQCARFCVFGVYKFNKKSLEVVNPLSCKNNCPACGRTCPASAIIFPRLPESSPLSGAEPESADKTIKPAPKEGLFSMLNERNSVRRNIFRQGVMQQAEAEKLKAIAEFKKAQQKK